METQLKIGEYYYDRTKWHKGLLRLLCYNPDHYIAETRDKERVFGDTCNLKSLGAASENDMKVPAEYPKYSDVKAPNGIKIPTLEMLCRLKEIFPFPPTSIDKYTKPQYTPNFQIK